jgi:hypothetical protein
MPLPTTAIIDWLISLGWDTTEETGVPFKTGPYVPDSPDRMCVVTPTPGPGFTNEGATDVGGFQLRTRGTQNDPDSAEADAFAIDRLIFAASFPVTLPSGQVITRIGRMGGPPVPLSGTPDDGDRTEFTCTYLCIAST